VISGNVKKSRGVPALGVIRLPGKVWGVALSLNLLVKGRFCDQVSCLAWNTWPQSSVIRAL